MIYIPEGCWHCVWNIEDTVAVTHNSIARRTFDRKWQEFSASVAARAQQRQQQQQQQQQQEQQTEEQKRGHTEEHDKGDKDGQQGEKQPTEEGRQPPPTFERRVAKKMDRCNFSAHACSSCRAPPANDVCFRVTLRENVLLSAGISGLGTSRQPWPGVSCSSVMMAQDRPSN